MLKAFYIAPIECVCEEIEIPSGPGCNLSNWRMIDRLVPGSSYEQITLENEQAVLIRNADQDSRFISIQSNDKKKQTFGRVLILGDDKEEIVKSLTDKQLNYIKNHIVEGMQENRITKILSI